MTKIQIIVNHSTGEIVECELSPEEIEQLETEQLAYEEGRKLQADATTARKTAKASAQSKLAALGLTADEVTAIIGA